MLCGPDALICTLLCKVTPIQSNPIQSNTSCSTGVTRSYSSRGEVSEFSDHAIPCIRAGICKMAIPMTLKTNHIHVSALRLKTLTWSDQERWLLLLRSRELILVRKESTTLPWMTPLPGRLRVRLLNLLDMRFGMLNNLIDPLRRTD